MHQWCKSTELLNAFKDSVKCPYSLFQFEALVLKVHKVLYVSVKHTYMQPISLNHKVAVQKRRAPSRLPLW